MLLWELVYQKIPYKDLKVHEINEHVLAGKREIIKIGIKDIEIQTVLIGIIKRGNYIMIFFTNTCVTFIMYTHSYIYYTHNIAWDQKRQSRPSFIYVRSLLTELWEKYVVDDDNKGDHNNYTVYVPKDIITDELMQRYNIEYESDFKEILI